MFRVLLVAAPAGLWYLTSDVHRVPTEAKEFDRYAVPLSTDENNSLKRAVALSRRDLAQLFASAFYRSPSFAPERIALAVASWDWESNHDLYTRPWVPGSSVGNLFVVARRSRNAVTMSFKLGKRNGSAELLVKDGELQYATALAKTSDDLLWGTLGAVHGVYSRILLAGAKFKLMRDTQLILNQADHKQS